MVEALLGPFLADLLDGDVESTNGLVGVQLASASLGEGRRNGLTQLATVARRTPIGEQFSKERVGFRHVKRRTCIDCSSCYR